MLRIVRIRMMLRVVWVVMENDLGSESGVNIGSVVDGGRRSNIEDFFAPNSGVSNPVNIG